MIGKRNEGCFDRVGQFVDAGGDGCAHLAIRISVVSELDRVVGESCAQFIRAMAQDDDNSFHAASAQVIDAAFDDGLVPEREQRLESAHPRGATRR